MSFFFIQLRAWRIMLHNSAFLSLGARLAEVFNGHSAAFLKAAFSSSAVIPFFSTFTYQYQVDHWDAWGWHTKGDAIELPLDLGGAPGTLPLLLQCLSAQFSVLLLLLASSRGGMHPRASAVSTTVKYLTSEPNFYKRCLKSLEMPEVLPNIVWYFCCLDDNDRTIVM